VIDLAAALDRALAALRPTAPTLPVGSRLAGLGWATVELERAEAEIRAGWPTRMTSAIEAAPSVVLGATARLLAPPGPGWPSVVLLEPIREGRLAATLARHGEGWAVAWWDSGVDPAAHQPDLALGAPHEGPVGIERLIGGAGAPPSGPHHLLRGPATIRS
jgi:hypothetical protein